MVNSIDRDGTGHGLDNNILKFVPKNFNIPIIFTEGGFCYGDHFIEALKDHRINAVAIANLLNFIGNGLSLSRKENGKN